MFYDMEELRPAATQSEAHAEWHRNAGVPMGQPGCPQDACHPYDEEYAAEYDPEDVKRQRQEFEARAKWNGYGWPRDDADDADFDPPF